jgi:uncharacterized membrane protein YccC
MALRLTAPGTGRPNPRGATRMLLALIGPLMVGLAIGRPVLGMIAALAAFFTALIEPIGGYRAHVSAYLIMVPVNAAVAALASVVAGTVWQAGLAGLAVGVASGILIGSTSRMAVVGPFPLFLFVVVQGTAPQPALWAAAVAAATGALWVALGSIVLLPFAPFAPAEVHVAEGWKAVALLARDPRSERCHAMALSALETARLNIVAISHGSARWQHRRRQLWASTLQAEGAMLAIISLGASDAPCDEVLADADRFAASLAAYSIWHRRRPDPQPLQAAVRELVGQVQQRADATADPRDAAIALAPSRPAERLMHRLISGLEVLDADDPQAPPIPEHVPRPVLAPLKAAARWSSPGLRHGIRLGVGAGGLMAIIGAGGGDLLDLTTHGPWVTITLVDVLTPALGASLQRTTQRALGTAVGAILAAALIWLLGDPWLVAWAAIALGTTAAFIRYVNYAWFVALFTPLVLLIASTAAPMGPGVAGQRFIATLIGCGLGFLLATVLLPTRHASALPGALADAVDATADGIAAGLAVARAGGSTTNLAASQRDAMRAAGAALEVFDGATIESLTRRGADAPLADLQVATFALVERMAVMGTRMPERARLVPGTADAVTAVIDVLHDTAAAIRTRRAPAPAPALAPMLDAAWTDLGEAQKAGRPDPDAEGMVDGLEGIIDATQQLRGAATRWAEAARPA